MESQALAFRKRVEVQRNDAIGIGLNRRNVR